MRAGRQGKRRLARRLCYPSDDLMNVINYLSCFALAAFVAVQMLFLG